MNLRTILTILGECLDSLSGKISYKKDTVKAFKSYERKARHDYQKANGVRLTRLQRITQADLLKIRNCDTIEALMRPQKKLCKRQETRV